MKAKTIGKVVYIVVKYYLDAEGNLKAEATQWITAENAFNERDKHRSIYGIEMAHVFKAKLCTKDL